MDEVKLGRYRHCRGNEYEVLGVGHHSETLEELVFYRALYDDPKYGPRHLWVRPKKMFMETVERNGKKMSRFEYLGR